MFASLAPARRRLALGVLVVTVVIVVVVSVAVVLSRSGRSRTHPVPQDIAGPVLLVPGYGGSTDALQPLAAGLRTLGKTVEIAALPDNALGDLATQAAALNREARALIARNQARSVDVVGYSAGGVVTRLWVRNYGGASLVRRVVTLGSPQHGTQLASLGAALGPSACPIACQQLAPGAPVLTALNSGDETPAGPTWISVWTTHDNVVLPPESASLSGAFNLTVQSLCPTDTVDHSGLPRDPVVQRIVIASLGVTEGRAAAGCATR